MSACCHNPPRIVSFDVQPPQMCKGTSVTLTWEVVGPARLSIVPGPKDREPDANDILAKETEVPSKGTQTKVLSESTWFVLRAVDANQAKVQWQGKKPVDVIVSKEPKTVSTDCDSTGKCSGRFTLNPPHGSMRVVHLEEPQMTLSGKTKPATVLVTHDSLTATQLAPDHPLDVSVPADGDWTLEATLPADQQGGPPPKLGLTAQFSCP